MDKQFTASEVRNEASNHWRLSDGPQQTLAGKMLQAYADLLEADEKAVPVKLEYYDAGLLNDFGGGNVIWWWDYMRNELGRAHSFYQSQVNDMMLVAHSAQAQPPAASVTEALRLLQSVLCDTDGNCCIRGTYEDRRTVDKALAMLAAQENPNG